ncbi:MAG TPA: ATP-binding cassette domain-containing protein, partial [Holophagaceae bacterium]|nr:ATP-binding cassette domain-containing protein [Holophagaceae bacterium]
MSSIIQTTALTKVYGSNGAAVHALRGIDLTVEKGEFVALIGPSGSGKSTLMAILGCLDLPTEGTYTLDGRQVQGLSGG